MWRCEVLVVMTRKVFWNAYRQRYVKSLRNRPFNPKIICKNLWFGLAKNFTNHTIFLHRFFSHKLTQITTNNLIVESRGIRVSPQKTTNRRASVRFPTIKRKSGICEICVSPKTPTKWDPCEPQKHPQSGICVRLWKRGWDFFGEPFGNSQKKAIFVN